MKEYYSTVLLVFVICYFNQVVMSQYVGMEKVILKGLLLIETIRAITAFKHFCRLHTISPCN
jgi:hypothetical protein